MPNSGINFENLPNVLQRLLRLMSTPFEQKVLGDKLFPYLHELADEFKALGCQDVEVNAFGTLFATLPSNVDRPAPKLGFLASYGKLTQDVPDAPSWRLMTYHGGEVCIRAQDNVVLTPNRFPELARSVGQDMLISDGQRPLHLKSRVGIALMLGILEHFHRHPEDEHAELRFAITPEMLIAQGEKYFDLERFGADYAYELSAPGLGTLITESFNAARAVVTLRGHDTFPGFGKDRLVNAITLMRRFLEGLPREETPERTDGHEGFFHPVHMEGSVDIAKCLILIRDFGFDSFEVRKSRLKAICQDFEGYGADTCNVTIVDEYENMGRVLSRSSRVVKQVMHACRAKGVPPEATSVRGTTDGARLTSRGLPCPALFIGTQFVEHGPYHEMLPIFNLEKAQAVMIELSILSSNLKSLA